MNDVVVVKTYPNRMEADLARSLLEANGVRAFIEADDAGGAYPFPLSGHMKGVKLLIKKADEKKAHHLLNRD